jgi:hypothetical protein
MKKTLWAVPFLLVSTGAFAQVTPAAGYTPPNDTPSFKVGATIFTDYTYQNSPRIQDADKENVNLSSFNVSRAYINVTGSLNHYLAFRITPDIVRETTAGSALNGSLTFRLKYAYGQLNLDDWTTHGSWVRFGINQTPYIDYTEGIYRYRFQGPIFVDREGFLSSADAGVSGHWNFPGNYGDVHAGFFNGENYNHTETNNQKAFEVRGTVRPLPLGGVWKGLRVTGFADQDKPSSHGQRQRRILQATFEHPLFNAGVEYLQAKDKALGSAAEADAKGWSAWATPRLGNTGWEALLRHDDLEPNKDIASQKRKRNIAGIAYWFHPLQGVQTALLADYDSLERTGITPSVPRATNYAVHMLVNF